MRLLLLRSLLKRTLPESLIHKIKVAITKLKHFGYLDHFDLQTFAHLKPPSWMTDQIKSEFSPFSQGITQEGLDRLEKHLSESRDLPKCFLRFRIIDGNIYLKGSPSAVESNFILYKSLFAALGKTNQLPNIDFIFHSFDATPCEGLTPSRFWLKNSENPAAPLLTYGKLASSHKNLGLVSIPFAATLHLHKTYLAAANRGSALFPWEQKKAQAIWRGSDSDLHLLSGQIKKLSVQEIHNYYQSRPRYRVSQMSAAHPKEIDAGFSYIGRTVLNPLVQTLMKETLSVESQLKYKYVINLDGWGWPTSFIWSIASNSLSLKMEPGIIDWYYAAFKPFEHYLPIQKDLSDLLDLIEWARAQDAACREMAVKASKLFRSEATSEHGLLYLSLVFKEYAKQQKFNVRSLLDATRRDKSWVLFHSKNS